MKKITALFLALLMLALPVMGMAASPAEMVEEAVAAGQPLHTAVTFRSGTIPGMAAEEAAIINDLLDALGFTVEQQEGDAPQVDFAMQLSGADVLTLSFASKGEDNYLKSNFLGEAPVVFNGEEGIVLLNRLVDMAVAAEMIPQSEADELKKNLEDVAAQIGQIDITAEVNMEDMDFTGMLEVAANLVSKAKIEEVTAQPKNSDPAAQMVSINLTGEDIAQVYDKLFEILKSNESFMQGFAAGFEGAVNEAGEPITAEEFMNQAPQMMREAMSMIQGEVPVVLYLDEAGEPVYGTMSMTMVSEGDTMTMDMNYARLTVNQGITHTATVIAKESNGTGVAMTFNMLQSPALSTANLAIDSIENEAAKPVMNVAVNLEKEYGETKSEDEMDIVVTITDSDDGQEVSFRVEIESEAEKISEEVVMYESEIEIYLMDSEEDLFTIHVNEVTGAAAESIVTADAVRPGAMTDEEFNAYASEVTGTAMVSLFSALQYLPESILMLMQ